jgi:GNAT superfamily N-acetyltransferase
VTDNFKKIATIHKKELKDSPLAACSVKFLSFFYEKIVSYDSSLFFFDETIDDGIRGFIFERFISENKLKLFFFPSLYIVYIRNKIRNMTEDCTSKMECRKTNKNLIVYLAVDSGHKRKGIGKKLINTLENELKKRGINNYSSEMFLSNTNALKFYEALGFAVEDELNDICLLSKRID